MSGGAGRVGASSRIDPFERLERRLKAAPNSALARLGAAVLGHSRAQHVREIGSRYSATALDLEDEELRM